MKQQHSELHLQREALHSVKPPNKAEKVRREVTAPCPHGNSTVTSISTSAPSGSPATATVERAGLCPLKAAS